MLSVNKVVKLIIKISFSWHFSMWPGIISRNKSIKIWIVGSTVPSI